MALTLRHWIAAALVACAAVSVAYLPPDPSPERPQWVPERRRTALSSIEAALRRTNQLSIMQREQEEALAALRGAPRRARSPVFLDARRSTISVSGRRRIESSLTQAAAAFGPLDTSVTLAVSLVPNQSRTRAGEPVFINRLRYVFPAGTDGHACLVIVPDGSVTQVRTPQDAATVLGPCAYYAAFGQPGPQIATWLASVNYYPAQEAGWIFPRLPSPSPESEDLSDLTLPQLLSGAVLFVSREGISLPAAGCAAGRRERCGAVLGTTPWYRRFLEQPHTADKPGWFGASSDQSWYLADLVRAMGRDRFARFWRSPLPRDSAFAQAYGMPMEEWTHRWLTERHPDVLVGPAIRISSVLLGLLVAGGLVGGGAYYAARRQIG
jgi:hypothetical protein